MERDLFWEDENCLKGITDTFSCLADEIYKYQEYFKQTLTIKLPNIAMLQYYCFYIIDFEQFGIIYNYDKVLFHDDDGTSEYSPIFEDKLSDKDDAMYMMSQDLRYIDIDKEEIELQDAFNKFERYIFSISRGGDHDLTKEVFNEIFGLFRLIYMRLNPCDNNPYLKIMARKYKEIIDRYDYKEAIKEYKRFYTNEIISFDNVGYYLNYLYCLMMKFEEWLKDLSTHYHISFNDIIESKIDNNRQNNVPFQSQIEPPQPQLPAELDNEHARKYFDLAVEKGLMTGDYKWNKTKALLAFFAAKMSDKLSLSNRQNTNGSKQVSWKPFEALFNVKNLRVAFNDLQKIGKVTEGKIVEDIFNE